MRDYARPIWNAEHTRIVRILGAAQDITKNKQVEAVQRFLSEASNLLASSLDYETTLTHVAQLAIPQLADWCMIHLVDDNYTLRRVALTFADPAKQPLAEELQRDYPLEVNAPYSFPHVIRTGQPELIPEVSDAGLQKIAQNQRHLDLLRALGFCSTLSVPLIARDHTLGSIMLGTAESGRRYSHADLQIGMELASRVALAVDNARLFAERTSSEQRLRHQNEELNALHDMTFGLINRLEINSLLESLVVRSGALLDTPHGYLYVADPDQNALVVRVASGIFTSQVRYRLKLGQGLAGQVWQTGQALAIDNYGEWSEHRTDLDHLGLRALVSVPIRAGTEFMGVLGLAYLKGERTFGTAEISLLERFAELASLALENARLYSAAQQEIAVRCHTEAALRSAETDLRAAMALAEAATRSKSEFLAHMSHDMRTPLSSAIGITALLQQTNLDTQQHEMVEIIRASGDALLALLNNLLDLSKIEAGKLTLEEHPFELRACIEAAIDLVTGKVADKQLDLAYTLAFNAPTILIGDQQRLRQILVDLLSNAAKFTNTGGIFISVAARPLTQECYELHFSVADTGVGIAPSQLDKIFDSFHQLDSSAAAQSPGTGLGLTIGKRLSEIMGGRMWVESTLGIGSTFSFTVNLAAIPDPPGERSATLAGLAGRHMLVIDRHAQTQQALTSYAQSAGMPISVVGSLPEALALARTGARFDVVVADIRAAGGDQAALSHQLREQLAMPALPMILLAPLGQRDDRIRSEQHNLLRKPLKLSQLQATLISIFTDQRPGTSEHLPQSTTDERPASKLPCILVAEDDRANNQLAQRILDKLGYPHTSVSSGAQALAALEHEHYDIVLLDIQMPDLDGIEATRMIRRRYPSDRQPYLIALTATTSPDIRALCLQAGMNAYLTKPLQIPELQAVLARYAAYTADQPPHAEDLRARILGTSAADNPPAAYTPEPLDHQTLDRVRALFGPDQIGRLHELIERYNNDTAAVITRMHAANAAGDHSVLEHAVHQLKSSSAIVAALPLTNLCKQFETAMQTTSSDERQAWIDRIEAEFIRVRAALQSL